MAKLDEMITGLQTNATNDIATIKANDEAKARGYFPYHKFVLSDYPKIFKNFGCFTRMYNSLFGITKVIKAHETNKDYRTTINQDEFDKLNDYIKNTLQMDSWGVTTFCEKEIYKGEGIPYKNVIVMSKHMNKESFLDENFPNLEALIEIFDVYGDTGIASASTTEFLREMDFGAVPNHSVGGNIDYTKAGFKANLGFIGRHGMLITPESGPCNRLCVVYTSIENLDDFLDNKADHSFGKSFCDKCRKCFRTCPNKAVYKEPIIDEFGHVECISNAKCNTEFAYYACGVCISTCPFTVIGYDTIYSKVHKVKKVD